MPSVLLQKVPVRGGHRGELSAQAAWTLLNVRPACVNWSAGRGGVGGCRPVREGRIERRMCALPQYGHKHERLYA